MSSLLKMKMPNDETKIDLNKLDEFLWWCAHLGTSPERLLKVIGIVGSSAEKVQEYLHRRDLPGNP